MVGKRIRSRKIKKQAIDKASVGLEITKDSEKGNEKTVNVEQRKTEAHKAEIKKGSGRKETELVDEVHIEGEKNDAIAVPENRCEEEIEKKVDSKVISEVEKKEEKRETLEEMEEKQKDISDVSLKSLHSTEHTFSSLDISKQLISSLNGQGFKNMTDIQAKVIPEMLKGKSVVASAITGSGKTLSFLVPAIDLLLRLRPAPSDGTIVLIICPTRELALQTQRVAKGLLEDAGSRVHCGLIIGGSNRKKDIESLSRGCGLVVATPGRLLDHLENTPAFNVSSLRLLVLDEADHILDIGYADDMKRIGEIIHKRSSKMIVNGEKLTRQNALFSATVSEKIKGLVRQIFNDINTKNIEYLTTYEDENEGGNNEEMKSGKGPQRLHTAECVEQGYCICPAEHRFRLLYTFLRMYGHKSKIIVFLSTCASVRFHTDILCYIGLPCVCVHGSQHQMKRIEQLEAFSKAKTGVLLCTPLCARGLDIPNVSWIVQYDAPGNTAEYTHRVGRTGRMTTVSSNDKDSENTIVGKTGIDVQAGRTLLILQPSESGLVYILKKEGVPLTEFDFPESKLLNIQKQYEKVVMTNPHLYSSAREAFKAFYNAYTTHQLTAAKIYDPSKIELAGLAHAFGLETPPSIDFSIALRKRKSQRGIRVGNYRGRR